MTDEFKAVIEKNRTALKAIHREITEITWPASKEDFKKFSYLEKIFYEQIVGGTKLLRQTVTGVETILDEMVGRLVAASLVSKMGSKK